MVNHFIFFAITLCLMLSFSGGTFEAFSAFKRYFANTCVNRQIQEDTFTAPPPNVISTERNSTGSVGRGCGVLLACSDMLSGHISQVHRHTGFWAAALHEGLKTFHAHFYREDANTRSENYLIYNINSSLACVLF